MSQRYRAIAYRIDGEGYASGVYLIPNRIRGGNFLERGEVSDTEFKVVTRGSQFSGYLGMDPSRIPQFQEGEQEPRARKLVDETTSS
jgi:hypothetical protein